MPDFPADTSALTHLLVVSDLDRSRAWYTDVLGARVEGEYGGTSVVLKLLGNWLLLVTPAGRPRTSPGSAWRRPPIPTAPAQS